MALKLALAALLFGLAACADGAGNSLNLGVGGSVRALYGRVTH